MFEYVTVEKPHSAASYTTGSFSCAAVIMASSVAYRQPCVRPPLTFLRVPRYPNQLRRRSLRPERQLSPAATRAQPGDNSGEAPAAVSLPPESQTDRDSEWIAGIIAFWLNEEWTPLDVHADVGIAAGNAYARARRQSNDMSDLVLSLSTELLPFDFSETFVNAFDVANKVAELLMMRSGIDVCCTSEADETLISRFEST